MRRPPTTYIAMKKSPLLLVASIAPALFAGCVSYQHRSACEDQVRSAYGALAPAGKFTVSHIGSGIRGSRVVVEGTVQDGGGASPAKAKAGAQPVKQRAAAECLFDADKLVSLHWLAPAAFAQPAGGAADSGESD
jgi:hypothetical protein